MDGVINKESFFKEKQTQNALRNILDMVNGVIDDDDLGCKILERNYEEEYHLALKEIRRLREVISINMPELIDW